METRIQLVQDFFNEIVRQVPKDVPHKFDLWDLVNVLEIVATDDKDYTYMMDVAGEFDTFPGLQDRLYKIIEALEEIS